jgi:hypothetical protein
VLPQDALEQFMRLDEDAGKLVWTLEPGKNINNI